MLTSLKTHLGLNVKSVRKVRGFKQVELANLSDISTRYLQKIESGSVNLPLESLDQISKSVNIPACHLVRKNVPAEDVLLNTFKFSCPIQLIDLLPVGIQVNDPNGLILYVNRTHADFLGLSPYEIMGKNAIWDFLSDSQEIENMKNFFKTNVLHQPTPSPHYAKFLAKDRKITHVKFEWKPIKSTDEKNTGILSMVHYNPS